MTVADIDEGVLRERARRLLISGKLPGGDPAVSWAGSGRGEPCCVCQILVRPDEIGFDLSFRMPQREVELHMHSRCRIAWEQARAS
ncbi:MAG TPA: hypothetical protein VN705_07355 [Steroidobacteraceae bacterium]|jgi:hypothetical protein|nr:hypothetical protein [Steroidobacteraceae bacterium]